MKGKLVFISLAILSLFVLYFGTSSHTWDLVHKLELNLLVVFILFLCFAPTVQSGNDIQEFKTLRTNCDCGAFLRATGRVAKVHIYTRNGTHPAHHVEYRCSSKKCRVGHFYGFQTKGKKIHYDNNCLERPFFFTSRKTGFSVDLLYEFSLSIVHYQATFSALASHYKDLHLFDFDDEYLESSNERLNPTAKRIAEGWLTYSLVEIKQRYNISGPLYPSIDESLVQYNDLVKTEFSKRWSKHKCNVPGCQTVLVFDGGCKATRKICGAVKSGVREFSTTGFRITTGCTNHPAPGERFCAEHKDHKSPALSPDQLSKESLNSLNSQQNSREQFLNSRLERDNMFVVEGILEKKSTKGQEKYLIKWENYEKPTWEPKSNIPEFIINYYEKTGRSTIPTARVKHTKVVGGSRFHLLVWDDPSGEMNWEEEDAFDISDSRETGETGETETYSCNTRKDKDKRICRHSFGVLFGCWPCGVVTIFDELFRSEGVKQVYGIVTEWLAGLDPSERKRIKYVLYDDMCHLGPFSQNPVVLNLNEVTKFFGSRHLAVDCLHFLNHKDKKCQFVYDPYVPELNPVNTVICEQSFAWSNQYSNVKSMNGPRFNHFFHYLLDLHNLKVEGNIRHIANPHSEIRMQLILKQLLETVETPKPEEPEDDDEVTIMYYGDKCDCSKMAKCKSSKCICFIRGVKCGQDCHSGQKTNCTNK